MSWVRALLNAAAQGRLKAPPSSPSPPEIDWVRVAYATRARTCRPSPSPARGGAEVNTGTLLEHVDGRSGEGEGEGEDEREGWGPDQG